MVSAVRKLKNSVKETLPKSLRVLHTKGEPLIRLPQEKALAFERVKLHQNDRHFLIIDYDVKNGKPVVDHSHYDIEPNFVIYNPKNSNHQAYWFLCDAVHCQDESKYRKPFQYLRAIETAYDEKYGGDIKFGRYISRNPFFIGADTDWRHNERFKLKELADVVKLNQYRIKSGNKSTADNAHNSRNVTLFDELRYWAYKQDTSKFKYPEWQQRCLTQVATYNSFPTPMNIHQITSIAKSVAQYTFNNHFFESFDDYVARTHTSAIQALRGSKGGKVSKGGGRKALDEKLIAEIRTLFNEYKYSKKAIARELDISIVTVRKYLN